MLTNCAKVADAKLVTQLGSSTAIVVFNCLDHGLELWLIETATTLKPDTIRSEEESLWPVTPAERANQRYLFDLEERLVTVEQTLQNLVQGGAGSHSIDLPTTLHQSRTTLSTGANQHVERTPGADADRAVVFATDGETGFFGPSSNIALVRQLTKAAADRSWNETVAVQLNKLAFGPISPRPNAGETAEETIDPFALPPFEILYARIQHYFQWTAILYPFIHRDSFMAMLATLKQSPTGVRRTWLGILNLMQALAHNIPVSDNTEGGELYYRRAQALCDQQTLENINLEVVQYLLILGQYLQGSQQTMKAWITNGFAIKAAMQLGLHSTEAAKNLPPLDREVRKRIWFICVMLDRNLSMTFGRPPAVPDRYVRLPPVEPFSSQPERLELDSADFLNQTTAVNRIMWRIIDRLYDGNLGCGEEGSLTDLVSSAQSIDHELVEWECQLSVSMQLVSAAQLASGFVPSRFQTILSLRRHGVHLLIYRPLLLRLLAWDGHRRPDVSTSTLLSRTLPAAAESTLRSATECIDIVRTLLLSGDRAKATLLGAWWYTLYYTFNAALTLMAIYLVAITPATHQYLAGRLNLAAIQDTLNNVLVALRHIHPGSSITKKCELYLERLLSVIQEIHTTTQEQNAADLMVSPPDSLQLGSGALAPATGGNGAMYWENFLLEAGQLDDFGFGM